METSSPSPACNEEDTLVIEGDEMFPVEEPTAFEEALSDIQADYFKNN